MLLDVVSNTERGGRRPNEGNRTRETARWKQYPRNYFILRVRSGDGRVGRIDVREREHVIDPKTRANRRLPIAKYVVGKSHTRLKVMNRGVALPELLDRHNTARHRCRHDHRRTWPAARR